MLAQNCFQEERPNDVQNNSEFCSAIGVRGADQYVEQVPGGAVDNILQHAVIIDRRSPPQSAVMSTANLLQSEPSGDDRHFVQRSGGHS